MNRIACIVFAELALTGCGQSGGIGDIEDINPGPGDVSIQFEDGSKLEIGIRLGNRSCEVIDTRSLRQSESQERVLADVRC